MTGSGPRTTARRPRPATGRRQPVDWHEYAAQVKRAQRRLPRRGHPLAVSALASLLFTVAGIALLQLVGVGVGAGLQQLGRSVVGSLPKPQEATLVLGETPVNISAAPVLDGVPEFTRSNALPIAGKVPAFAVKPGRSVAISVNGKPVGTFAVAADGRFGGPPITLPDGPSTITASLVEGTTEVASTSAAVVVDRTPPLLQITRPKASDSVAGPDVVIEGKTEPGADVTVNERAVRPNLDGAFSDRLTAPAGPLALAIVAKDKAGNETKTQLSITVKPAAQVPTDGTALTVTLDRTKVRPGETVVARILATESAKPKAGVSVTLQVGVFTVGTYKTDATGTAVVGFAAPDHEIVDAAVVVLGAGTSARATLTVAKN